MNMPKLILLIGPPGCGKSTYAEKCLDSNKLAVHLSSDKIRKELWGDESIQGDNNQVFYIMQKRAIESLNNGLDVYYDATNMTRKDRENIIGQCQKFVQIEAHVIWLPIETCIDRDAARDRTVGKEVIDRMLKKFQLPYYDEGINKIKIIRENDFDVEHYGAVSMKECKIPHDNPHHTLNIYDHMMSAYNYAKDHFQDDTIALAAIAHDISKPYVKSFTDTKNNTCEYAHYYQHQCVSAWAAYGLYRDNELNMPYVIDVEWLIGVHMDPFLNTKYYNNLPSFLKEKVNQLHEADVNAH